MKKYDIQRSAKRVRVEVPVHLEQGSGITRDVSQHLRVLERRLRRADDARLRVKGGRGR